MTDKSADRYDADWQQKYASMIMTAEAAVAHVRPGQRIFISTAGSQPLRLVKALVARHSELADTQIIHSITLGEAPYAYKELSDHFSVNSFFVGANVRKTIQAGYGDYTPITLSDVPRLFSSGRMPSTWLSSR
jgi:acyl-CoA hydrolase